VSDVEERRHWDDYMAAYEDMIQHTATPDAPWHVVPADRKWFTRLVVAATVADAMSKLHLKFPGVDPAKRKELSAVRAALMRERT
jgi:polyphosphate kinase 2 (PPK2 family)